MRSSGEYADAVRRAAPGAIQVADRFHLIKNLGDVVLRVFQRRSESLRSIPAPGPHHLQLTRLRLDREPSRQQTRTQMRNLFGSIQALRQAGMNKSAIARFLGVHRRTVQKYAALESAPQRKPRVRKRSALAPYEGYILKRFADGCHNATQIHREISEQGYPGAYKNVWRIIQYLRKCERNGDPLPDSPPGLSASQAKGILITRPEKRTEHEKLTIESMKMVDGHIGGCCHLFEEFARLFREREDSAKSSSVRCTGAESSTSYASEYCTPRPLERSMLLGESLNSIHQILGRTIFGRPLRPTRLTESRAANTRPAWTASLAALSKAQMSPTVTKNLARRIGPMPGILK